MCSRLRKWSDEWWISAFLFAALVPLAANAQPAAPGGFAATAGDEEAVLTWSNPSNAGLSGYEFRFRAGDVRDHGAWAAVPGADANTVQHTVSGLVNGTRYFFELRAFDNDGPGAGASASTQLAESPSSAVQVPDAALRERIGRTLGLTSGATVTQGDLARLREVEASRSGIADLAGLEFAVNVEKLYLYDNAIADLSPLSGLKALTLLYLYGNEVTDVSSLSGLTALTSLLLQRNAISDLSPLAALTSLTSLRLQGNAISDLSPLAALTSLTGLALQSNEIADLSPLAGLTSLKYLWLANNAISDIAPLAGLTSLATLTLADNEIADMPPLSGLTSLTYIYLADNAISDLSPLADLTALAVLHLWNNAISDLSPLSGLASLTDIRLDANAISDVSPLGGLKQLSFLALGGNAVADISPLLESGLRRPESYVDLRGNPLGDGQAGHVLAMRESGTTVEYDDGGHSVPLFPSAAMVDSSATGFVRVINHSDEAGSVSVEAVDETGERRGPVTLAIGAGQARHFNAGDLERGNAAKGLRGSAKGRATGGWFCARSWTSRCWATLGRRTASSPACTTWRPRPIP